jgi:hypothetical protein
MHGKKDFARIVMMGHSEETVNLRSSIVNSEFPTDLWANHTED